MSSFNVTNLNIENVLLFVTYYCITYYLNVMLFTFLPRFLNKYLISDLINTTIHVVIIFFEQLFGLCPLLCVAESSWIHSSYSYSCKEKRRCGRGNCNLKRNVTNLLSWNILLKKKIYFWTTHINFSSYHYPSQILFRKKISFLKKLQFQQHFIFHFDFSSQVVITKHPNFITK